MLCRQSLSHQFMLVENVIQSLLMSRILIGYLPNIIAVRNCWFWTAIHIPTWSRRSVQPTDWSLRIFCRRPSRHQLIDIRSYNVNDPIMNNAKYDNKMRVRLAGVSDLMAAEGKYLKYCLTTFERTTARNARKCYFFKCYRRLRVMIINHEIIQCCATDNWF